MIVHVTSQAQFVDLLNTNKSKLVVVDFTASWCGPCRMIAPKFKEYSEDPENKDVVFLKVDVDENQAIAEVYKINCMPTFMFWKNGTVLDVHTIVGANELKLKAQIAALRT